MENYIQITRSEFDKANIKKQEQFEKDYLSNLNKTKLETMEKPVKPIFPDYKNFPKRVVLDYKAGSDPNDPLLLAYQKYYKDEAKYKLDLELFEQLKMVKDIQRSTLKLSLKKYKITKI